MAILTRRTGSRRRPLRRAVLLLGAAYLALVGGCIVLEKLGLHDPPLAFSHAQHAAAGMACEECHVPSTSGGPPGMPAADGCARCHDELDKDKPDDRKVAALYVDGKLRPSAVAPLPGEINFSHGFHTRKGLECGMCHVGVETSEAADASLMPTMADCQSCHEGAGVPPGCATCHKEIRTDARPPNHGPAWLHLHGSVVRGGSDGPASDCTLCHTEATCNTCHQAQAPPNHNNLWRLKTHGVVAAMDRQNCATCHRSDFCDRCHEDTLPLNHKGAWGAPHDKHCLTCHFPLQSESCNICHKGTPSHQEATPLPADHSPAMNCLQCHGISEPLPHATKGDACVMCHH